jgi:V/A-type H+-transporting ATPase subunit C
LLNAYGLPYGSLKVTKTQFLQRKDYEEMTRLFTPADFISFLGNHGYMEEISASSDYKGLDMIDVSNNIHLSKMNRFVLSVTPQNGKDLIVSYLTKWDIQNIKTILVSKNLNLKIEETKIHLISSSNSQLGIFAGLLDYNDYHNLLLMDRIEDIISYTLKFGYGKAMLSYLDDYRKTNDLSALLLSLDLYYYDMLKEKFRFYSGSEGPIYRFIRKTIDFKNIMTILKFIEFGEQHNISDYILSGGSLQAQFIDDLIKSGSVDDVIQKLKGYSEVIKGFDFYKRNGSLVGIEGELYRNMYWEFITILEMSSLSLNNIMAFLLRAEAEWKDIRNISFSKYYGIDDETIKMTTINMG